MESYEELGADATISNAIKQVEHVPLEYLPRTF